MKSVVSDFEHNQRNKNQTGKPYVKFQRNILAVKIIHEHS